MSNRGYYVNVRHDGSSAWLKPLGAPPVKLDDISDVAAFVWNVTRFGSNVRPDVQPSADIEPKFSIFISEAALSETLTENRVDLADPVKAKAFLGLVKNSARPRGENPTSAPSGLSTALSEFGF